METEIVLEDALALLDDETATRVLRHVTDRPRSAPAVAERCGLSRGAVYRWLSELEAAGLVRVEVELRSDGHHRHRYRNALDALNRAICPEGIGDTRSGGRSRSGSTHTGSGD